MKTTLALVAGLSGVLGAGAVGVTALPGFLGVARAQDAASEASALTEYEQNTIDVIEQYGPSVVSVDVSAQASVPSSDDPTVQIPEGLEDFLDQMPGFRDYLEEQGQQFGTPDGQLPEGQLPQTPPQQGSGSGFVIDDAGRILTNYHVVRAALQEGSVELTQGSEITVSFPDDNQNYPVRVVGANDFYDLALLELVDPDSEPESARPIPIADSDALQVGQKTIAIGNPFGFEFSVTAGEVIGINTAIIPGQGLGFGSAGNIGLGFAVPSNIIQNNLIQLETGGLTTLETRARLGVSIINIDDLPDEVRSDLELPEEGILVRGVQTGSPAEKAGLRGSQREVDFQGAPIPVGGDVITAVNGEPVATNGELQQAILSRNAGDTVEITYVRDGQEQTTEVTLEVVPLEEQETTP